MDFTLLLCDNTKDLNRRGKKRFCSLIINVKSPSVYEDLKRLHAKTVHGLFVKLKTALRSAKKWQPSFDGSRTQIIKRCKLCTHHSDIIINTKGTLFNDIMQVETIRQRGGNPRTHPHDRFILRFYNSHKSLKYGRTYSNRHLLLPSGYRTEQLWVWYAQQLCIH